MDQDRMSSRMIHWAMTSANAISEASSMAVLLSFGVAEPSLSLNDPPDVTIL
jgi:hypothetical protein